MELIAVALFTAGTVVLALGLTGSWIKSRFWVSEPLICLLVGAIIGPPGLALVDRDILPSRLLVEALAHVTLGITVMEAGLRLPSGYVRRRIGPLIAVLLAGLPLMWLTSAALVWAVAGMPVLTALMVGAFLAPTDPVLASDIVVSERAERDIPAPVRHLLTGESGATDGMGQVMLMAPILFMAGTAVTALSRLVVDEILWGVVAAAIIGVAMGDLAGRLMVWARSRSGHNAGSTITVGIALSVSVLSAVQLIGSGSILAVFAAGLRFKRYVAAEETSHPATQASAARFFTLPFFLVPGPELPVADWIRMAPATIGAVVLVVLLRRLPWWLMLRPWLGHRCRWRDTAFPGWFGPIGTAAIYYALWAEDRTGIDFWAVATLAVTLSAALHGVTATPLTNWLFRSTGRDPVRRR